MIIQQIHLQVIEKKTLPVCPEFLFDKSYYDT